MGKTSLLPPTKHAGRQHAGRQNLRTFPRTNPGLRDTKRAGRRRGRNIRPRRPTSEPITRTLDQLELVVQVGHTMRLRVSSQYKGAGAGEVLRGGRSMTKLDQAFACIQKVSLTPNRNQPSNGKFFFMQHTKRCRNKLCSIKVQCVTLLAIGFLDKTNCVNIYCLFLCLYQADYLLMFFGYPRAVPKGKTPCQVAVTPRRVHQFELSEKPS